MKIEEYLESLKKEYEKTDATWHLRMSGWDELSNRIGLLEPNYKKSWWKNFAITFALILLFLGSLFGTYKVALAAMPGDPMYPVKILSEKLVQRATGDSQIVIDHRASEIVDLSKKEEVNRDQLRQVVSEYRQTVEETKKEIQISGRPQIKFQEKLEDQHSEFDKISHDNPEIRDEIKDAQDVSNHSENREVED